jgi:DNA mismatch endonuclease (patch repair protein)
VAEFSVHRYKNYRIDRSPITRREFWLNKLEANVARDRVVKKELEGLGWQVITVWECELRTPEELSRRLTGVLIRNSETAPN